MHISKIREVESDVREIVAHGESILALTGSRGSGGALNEFQVAEVEQKLEALVSKSVAALSKHTGRPVVVSPPADAPVKGGGQVVAETVAAAQSGEAAPPAKS